MVSIPAPILLLLERAYPHAVISHVATTVGGFSNTTLALRIDDKPYILKAADRPEKRADLQHEATILALLANAQLPTAPLVALLEGQDWSVELLGYLPGVNGIQYLTAPGSSAQPPDPVTFFSELGTLLRRVHGIRLPASTVDFDLSVRAPAVAAKLATLSLPPDLHIALTAGLTRAATPVASPCLIHGDPGAHNLLWDGTITGLLDWEWAGSGNPLVDLAWVCWTIRFRGLPDATRQAFLAAYGMPDPDPVALREFSLAQIAMILTRVATVPEARQEWVRRLEATLAAV